jgi:hypothetical protein
MIFPEVAATPATFPCELHGADPWRCRSIPVRRDHRQLLPISTFVPENPTFIAWPAGSSCVAATAIAVVASPVHRRLQLGGRALSQRICRDHRGLFVVMIAIVAAVMTAHGSKSTRQCDGRWRVLP